MAKRKRGAPKKASGQIKDELIQLRVKAAEKETFRAAAKLSGLSMSSWMRERLLERGREELEQAGQSVPFLPARSPRLSF
jgi:uncharacterized protein (DUF1778 family)